MLLAVLCLGVAAAVLQVQVVAQASAADSVTHTREVLQRVALADLSITQAEASGRGFLLTGDLRQAQRYDEASQVNGEQLRELADLTRDNAKQQAVLAHLTSESERRLEILRANVERRRGGGRHDVELLHDGSASMARLVGYSAQLKAEEEGLLAERRATALAARHGIAFSAALIIGLACTLALLVVLRSGILGPRAAPAGRAAGDRGDRDGVGVGSA